jgi:uncharacterized integral membrane protein
MRWARRLLWLGLFVALLVAGWRLAAQNSAPVSVDYLVGRIEDIPLWAVLLGAFGVGVVLSGLVGLYQVAKLGMLTRRYRKTAHGLEAEVHQLRNLPLSEVETPGDVAGEGGLETPTREALKRGA